ncbi:MAG: presenilin family intramembrane aspartyl protease [Candidatus Thermoplasmatota archaeon]|nr:presenilin family intramembrane aspartyl protease [Candidatus Thermoplasmatota archaeon]MCL5989274.1 presenilin family intramembrane aspartyl protease [Candidatus Thermoplasmatota archaeon]
MPNALRNSLPEVSSLVLFISSSLFAVFISTIVLSVEPSVAPSSSTSGLLYIAYYLVAAVVFSAVIIVLSKRFKMNFLKWIFIALIGFMVFYVWSYVGALIAQTYLEYYVMVIGAPLIIMALLVVKREWYVIDIAGFFLCAGLASILGTILGIWAAVIFLAAFAVYDYISVYKTKHMVSLAKVAVDAELPMLFIFPNNTSEKLGKVELTDEGVEGHKAMLLGFGDIAFPGIMVVASAIYGYSVGHPLEFILLPLLGGIAGMMLLVTGKIKKPAPGLPFLNTGVILGFLACFLYFTFVL